MKLSNSLLENNQYVIKNYKNLGSLFEQIYQADLTREGVQWVALDIIRLQPRDRYGRC